MPTRQKATTRETSPARLQALNQTVSRQARRRALIVFAMTAFALGSITAVFAQDTPKPQLPTQPSASPAAQPPSGERAPSAPSKVPGVALYNLLQAKSIVFPDIAASAEPLSPGQKFELFVDNSISVHTIKWSVLGAGVGQAEDSPTGFGQGWDAYAKRFGASMARSASTEFFGTYMLASALHEDPRFYAEINPPFFHAVKYSVRQVFVMRSDDGREVVAWSRLAGPLMSEGLANVYWPDRNRTVGDTLFRYGLDLASRAGGNMLREYWPVFYARMRHTPQPAPTHN